MVGLWMCQEDIDKLVTVDRVVPKRAVYGVAYNDFPFVVKIEGRNIWQYDLWHSMLKRCLTSKYKDINKTYKNVTVCDEWLSFANFLEWVNKEVGYNGKPVGFDLDKDLMLMGNQTYCPQYCSFVPKHINQLLTNTKGGVFCRKKKGRYGDTFTATFRMYNSAINLGTHYCREDAVFAYKTMKEAHVKSVAERFRSVIKDEVYQTLMNWEVDISD
jgi:hypothetical protein